MDNDFILMDRLQKIRQIITKYGENNFYISYSGGKDSNVLSALVDMAIPENTIPRVYCNTGIEYNDIVDFVKNKAGTDSRFIIIQPRKPIKQMLEEKGYPFKSKMFAQTVYYFKKLGKQVNELPEDNFYRSFAEGTRLVKSGRNEGKKSFDNCPDILKYIFFEGCSFNISDKCCEELKEKPLDAWQKENDKSIAITGITRDEGGRRCNASCVVFKKENLHRFNPLSPITKDWEKWFIQKYNIELPILYYPPYNFDRTGCKGCPFALYLQDNLDTLMTYLPKEYRQCEIIWSPVYSEYRRIGYRLRKQEEINPDQISMFDISI